LANSVEAALSCSVTTGSCANTTVFKMSATTNAHAELPGQTYYNYYVCCSGVTGLGNDCNATNKDVVLRLSNTTNAHVEKKTYTNYTNLACLSAPAGPAITCSYTTDTCSTLGTDYVCLATISGDTNAHVGDCNAYSTKVCCQACKTNGQTCLAGGECCSGNCVDGVCCNSSCTGTCQACNLAGSVGTCTTRPADDNTECAACNRCDGTNTTCQAQTADNGYNCIDDCTYCLAGTCTNRAQCADAECTGQERCDTAGGNCADPDANSIVCNVCYSATWDSVTSDCCGDDGVNDDWCNAGDGSCVDGTWYANHCTDGIQNCDETGIDCGGVDCPACDTIDPTTIIKIIRKSTGDEVTGGWLRADTYTIKFEDNDPAPSSGWKECQYYVYACDVNGVNCGTTPEKIIVPPTARTCGSWSFDITAGKTAPTYNLEGYGRYFIYSIATDNANNSGTNSKFLHFDFTPPWTEIK